MAVIATSAAMAQQLQYPKAAKDGTVDEYFGTKVADPYRWLENDTSAQTAAWVEAENKVTNDFLSRISFRQKLLKRLTQLANYDSSGAPFKRHGRWYVSKRTGLQNQSSAASGTVSDTAKGNREQKPRSVTQIMTEEIFSDEQIAVIAEAMMEELPEKYMLCFLKKEYSPAVMRQLKDYCTKLYREEVKADDGSR